MAAADTQESDPQVPKFTCISCRVVFRNAEAQRGHYKSDWHRYNLKRKVAEMLPVSAENFKERVLSHRALAEAESQTGKRHNHCVLCRKHFSSDNAYQSHLRSKKHREVAEEQDRRTASERLEREVELAMNLANTEEIMEHSRDTILTSNKEAEVLPSPRPSTEGAGPTTPSTSTVSDGEWEDCTPQPLDTTDCLFCRHKSVDLEANLHHMSLAHSFFLPDAEYVVDLKGLIRYLGEKVGVGFVCVHCNTRGKTFHSLEAVQKHMVDKGHTQLLFEGDTALEYADYYDYSPSYPDHKEGGKEVDPDATDSSLSVNDNLELVLPSGATVGHRSFQQYYRQNLTSSHAHSLVPRRADVGRVLTRYLAIGYRGPSEREVVGRRANWEAFQKRAQNSKKWELQIGVKGNKLQHRFRQQVTF